MVWVSGAMQDSTRIKLFEADNLLADFEGAVAALRAVGWGEPLPDSLVPGEFYGKYDEEHHNAQQDLFQADGYWIVSSACADVLRAHDMSDNRLFPVKLFQHDRSTPVEGSYFCLSIGSTKGGFLPDSSPRARRSATKETWRTPLELRDDDIGVSQSASDGADLWVDPRLTRAFFVSDRLVEALRSENIDKYFSFKRCTIVPSYTAETSDSGQ